MKNYFKKTIYLIILLTFLILPAINVLAASPRTDLDTAVRDTPIGTNASLVSITGVALKTIIGLIGVIFLIELIYGGIVWLMSQGDEKQVTKAKGLIKSAVIGLIIVFASYAIAFFVIQQIQAATGVGASGS